MSFDHSDMRVLRRLRERIFGRGRRPGGAVAPTAEFGGPRRAAWVTSSSWRQEWSIYGYRLDVGGDIPAMHPHIIGQVRALAPVGFVATPHKEKSPHHPRFQPPACNAAWQVGRQISFRPEHQPSLKCLMLFMRVIPADDFEAGASGKLREAAFREIVDVGRDMIQAPTLPNVFRWVPRRPAGRSVWPCDQENAAFRHQGSKRREN